METGRIAIIKLTKIFRFIIFMHKYNMIRRQCVKLKAQTHLNMPIVYAQSYGYHYKNTFSYFILRLLLSLICFGLH